MLCWRLPESETDVTMSKGIGPAVAIRPSPHFLLLCTQKGVLWGVDR